ncbi:MAG: hypothetical protein EOP04_08625 [Proteobacteria bacterium]|nr:MAG: hypothetical protein EOP04_08625 [Pseudomonadota bacterium]
MFSASKSISTQALVFGDGRLLKAHAEASREALSVIEQKYSNFRIGSNPNREIIQSGKLIVAQIGHFTSREKDPKIHHHSVIFSLLETNSGKGPSYKAMHTDALYKDSKLMGLIYQNALGKQALQLGYEISDNGKGSAGLVGFTKAHEQIFSKRTQKLNAMGVKNQKDARSKVLIDRKSKGEEAPLELLREGWLKEAKAAGLEPLKPSDSPIKLPDRPLEKAVELAIAEVSERSVSFRKESVHAAVLENNLGFYTYKEITQAVDALVGNKIFETTEKDRYVSLQALEVEKGYRDLAQGQMTSHTPVMSLKEAKETVRAIANASSANGRELTEGQKDLITHILSSPSGLQLAPGPAGAGKTASFRPLAKVLQDRAFELIGYAPSAAAAQQLALGAAIKTDTLESLLLKGVSADGAPMDKKVILVDEASMISAKDLLRLLELQKEKGFRLVLSGDSRQLDSVGSGAPFRDLLALPSQISKVELTQSVRQINPKLKEAVAVMNKGDVPGGLRMLSENIVEVKDSLRSKVVAKHYLGLSVQDRERAVIIAKTNLEAREITNFVQKGLKKEGLLGPAFEVNVYAGIDLPEARLRSASATQTGDILIAHRGIRSAGITKNTPYEVIERDTKEQILYLKGPMDKSNQSTKLDLKKHNQHSLYRKERIHIHEGDTLAWTRNQKGEGRLNNDRFKVEKIHEGNAIIRYESGKQEIIDLTSTNFLQTAAVLTSYKAQGISKWEAIISAKSATRESIYTDVTRAVSKLTIFTENKETLYKQAGISGANKIASEIVSFKDRVSEKMKDIFPDIFKTSADQQERSHSRGGHEGTNAERDVRRDEGSKSKAYTSSENEIWLR